MNSKHIGVVTEYKLKLWFLKQGYVVCEPIGDNSRYDFLVEINNNFIRFQSKTGNLTRRPGCLNFSCASVRHNESKGNYRVQYTDKEIDYFITCHPLTEEIFIVPVEECGNEFNIRLEKPKNNNVSNCHMAENYEGKKMMEKIIKKLS